MHMVQLYSDYQLGSYGLQGKTEDNFLGRKSAGLLAGATVAGGMLAWRRYLRSTRDLAKEKLSDAVPPSWLLFLREGGWLWSSYRGRKGLKALAKPFRASCDRRPIMLIPGFLADRNSLFVLYAALRLAGYRVRYWGLGRNLGASPESLEASCERLDKIYRKHEEPVTLIGWSLGGLYAREVAKNSPDKVREVITLGTPFSGDPRANNLWWLYERIAGHDVDTPPIPMNRSEKPPVPTTAFWSARDGIIAPASARGEEGERDLAIEVHCGHNAYVLAPEPLAVLLGHLETTARRE